VAAHVSKSVLCWVGLIEAGVQCSMFLFPCGLHFLASMCHTRGHCGTYHILLDINWDLFGQSPSCKQDVGKAIFGFGQVDNKVISRGIVFPLFVCDPRKRSRKFTYLGNYTATRLDPVAWGKLSKEVCFFHV